MDNELDPDCYSELVFMECDKNMVIGNDLANTSIILYITQGPVDELVEAPMEALIQTPIEALVEGLVQTPLEALVQTPLETFVQAPLDLEAIVQAPVEPLIQAPVVATTQNKQNVTCETCKRNFLNKEQCDAHNAEMHKKKQYLCSLCTSVFKRQDSMKRHLQNVHFTTGFCICPVCKEDCKNRRFLLKHLKNSHGGKPQVFSCRECDFKCGNFIDLEQHEKSHLPERKRFVCKLCAAIFRRTDHLRRHMRNVHSSFKCTKCPVCKSNCKSHTLMILHIKKSHPDHPKKFECNVCAYECGLVTDFEFPEKPREIPHYPCPTCGKVFKRKDHLLRHVNGEHIKKALPCPICNRPYKRQETVIHHLKKLHKMDYVDGQLIPIPKEQVKNDLPLLSLNLIN